MASFEDGLRDGLRDGFCGVFAVASQFEDFFGKVNELWGAPYYNISRGFYRSFCNQEPPPRPPMQYNGGACPVAYQMTTTFLASINGGNYISSTEVYACSDPATNAYGPFTGFRLDTNEIGIGYAIDGFDFNRNPKKFDLTSRFNPAVWDLKDGTVSFSRCDGQPDECGEPTPEPVPPGYNIFDIDINYTDNSNVDIQLDTRINIRGPIIDINNQVKIPIRISIDDINIGSNNEYTAYLNISTGGIEFNIGGDFGYDDRGGDRPGDKIPEREPPPPRGDDGSPDVEEEDDPTQAKTIIGVICITNAVGERIGAIFNERPAPDIWVPYLGWVIFRVRVGASSSALLKHIPINLLREFIPVPWEDGAISYEVVTPNGATIEHIPVYRKVDAPQFEE